MLKIITMVSILFSLNALASTNGGGVLRNAIMKAGIDRNMSVESTHGANSLSEKIISLRAEPAADMGGSGGGGVLITEGGGGGGGVLKIAEPNTRITAPEIVFKISENQGRVRFAYGQLIEGKWEIRGFEIPENKLAEEPEIVKALENSKANSSWAAVN